MLSPDRLRRDGYLAPELIATKWTEHLSGHSNWQHQLRSVLKFQQWLEARRRVTL